MSLIPYLHRAVEGISLSADEACLAMSSILEGDATPVEIAGLLIALRMKGETVDELVGFASAMRSKAAWPAGTAGDGPLLDTCGTGGDGAATFNISTVSAFVVAGAGARVAKHGNRSISSRSGSADVMEALGVRIALQPAQMARSIRETGIGFLFAPAIHTATRHVQPVRAELKMRTAFNLLGPLTNPAGASAQLAGAPSPRAAHLMAGALARLGLEHGFVAHGSDGLDEITTTGPTRLYEIRSGEFREMQVEPGDFRVPAARAEDLKGGDAAHNAEIARAILAGEPGPRRNIVLVNAAAALVACGLESDFLTGMARAADSVDSGNAARVLGELVRFTQSA
jgi:anthranilate phosphoribosyltransferase